MEKERVKRIHRVAVGLGLKGKLREFEFYISRMVETSALIRDERRAGIAASDRLLHLEYYFSAFLNSVQSIKDAVKSCMGVDISWRCLSPRYGPFIYYCRNAATHDGSAFINAGEGGKNYILGPLVRLDKHEKVGKTRLLDDDVLTIVVGFALDMVSSLEDVFDEYRESIISPDDWYYTEVFEHLVESSALLPKVRRSMSEGREGFSEALVGYESDTAAEIEEQIDSLRSYVVTQIEVLGE